MISQRFNDTEIQNWPILQRGRFFKLAAMRAQSAALGMAAAAIVTSAAAALPCAPALSNKTTTSEFSCIADPAGSPPRDREDDEGAAAPQGDTPAASQLTVLADTADVTDSEIFDGTDIKITNLQATMTSNKYVAGRLPLAPARPPVDDLIMFSPDYLSIKLLPHVPKRSPVGVGLVTVPKPTAKDGEKATPAQGLQPARK